MGGVSKLLLPKQRRPEFESVDSFVLKEGMSIVVLLRERPGEIGSAVKVVMVIMTFDSTPTGGSRRIGTREIIFGSRLSSTRIVCAAATSCAMAM